MVGCSLFLPNPGAAPDPFGRESLSLSGTLPVGVWCFSYGHAAHSLCVAWICTTSYILPNNSQPSQVWRFLALGEEGATKLQFLNSLSMGAGTVHKVFPLPLI